MTKTQLRAFDVMLLALVEAGFDPQAVEKLVREARRALGVPPEEAATTKVKVEFAALSAEMKDDPSLDRSAPAAPTRKARPASESSLPNQPLR